MGNLQSGGGGKGRHPEDSSFDLGFAPDGWVEVERDEGCRFACLAAPITDGVEFPYDNKPEHGAFLNRQNLSIHTYCWYPTKPKHSLPRFSPQSSHGISSPSSAVNGPSGGQASSLSCLPGARSRGSIGTARGRSFSSLPSTGGSSGGSGFSFTSSFSSPSFAPSLEASVLEKAEAVVSCRGIVVLLHGYCGHSRLAWLHKSLPTDHERRDPTVNGYRPSDIEEGKSEKDGKGKRPAEESQCPDCSGKRGSCRKTSQNDGAKTSGVGVDEKSTLTTQRPGGRENPGVHISVGTSMNPPTKVGTGAFGTRVGSSGAASMQSEGGVLCPPDHCVCTILPAYHVKYQGSWVEALNNAGFLVTAMDLQGHGLSEGWQKKRASVRRLDDFAVDVIQFLAVIRRRCQFLRGIHKQYVQQTVGEGDESDRLWANVKENSKDGDDVDEPLPIFLMGLSLGGWVAARTTQLLGDPKVLASLLQVCSPDAPLPSLPLSEIKKHGSFLSGRMYTPVSSPLCRTSLSPLCPIGEDLAKDAAVASNLSSSASKLSSSGVSGKETNGHRSSRKHEASPSSSPPYLRGVSGCVLLSPMLDLSFVKTATRYTLYRPLLGRMADWTPHVIVSKPMPNLQYPYLEEYIQRDKYTYKGGSRVRMVREMFEGTDVILQGPQIDLMSEKTCGALLLIHNLLDQVCGVEGSLRLFHGAKLIRDKSFLAVNAYVGGSPTTQYLHSSQRGQRGGVRDSVFLTTPAGALAAERNTTQVFQGEEKDVRPRKRGGKSGRGKGSKREDQGVVGNYGEGVKEGGQEGGRQLGKEKEAFQLGGDPELKEQELTPADATEKGQEELDKQSPPCLEDGKECGLRDAEGRDSDVQQPAVEPAREQQGGGEGKEDNVEQDTRKRSSVDTNQSVGGIPGKRLMSSEDGQQSKTHSSLFFGDRYISRSIQSSSTSAEGNEDHQDKARYFSKSTIESPDSSCLSSLPGSSSKVSTAFQPPRTADSLTTASTKLSVRFDHGESGDYTDISTAGVETGSSVFSTSRGPFGEIQDSQDGEGVHSECGDDNGPRVLPKNLYVECNVEASLLEEVRAYADPQLHGLDVHHSLPSEPDGDKILARVMQWLVQHARLQPQ
ncbi:pst-a-like protein [Cystoisospora suis]|uniref:Pst-a-like protein n=1 Tax=Cystoisospora suis TaxID=483139 RepID=A0A2C6L7T8_9APIC|nr:pst-a-like protein [Cystoisospora suis]